MPSDGERHFRGIDEFLTPVDRMRDYLCFPYGLAGIIDSRMAAVGVAHCKHLPVIGSFRFIWRIAHCAAKSRSRVVDSPEECPRPLI